MSDRGRILWMAVLAPVLAFTLGCPPEPGPVEEPCAAGPVTTQGGEVCGTRVEADGAGVEAFLGIPFAETTAGSNRWKPPIGKASWEGTLQADAFGPICPQAITDLPAESLEAGVPGQSEDCLSVNVWRPAGVAPGASLPVMVWIYGGGFLTGASSLPVYDGSFLSADQQVLVVSFNYRLGALGFLAGVDGLRGNYGFLDQQLALKWVQHNIDAFGGDPGKVTIFGESAGAMSVGLHLLSAPSSEPLSRAAVMESNPLGLPYKTLDQARVFGRIFKFVLGCTFQSLDCMRGKTVEEVLEAQSSPLLLLPVPLRGLDAVLAWSPVVDGQLITRQPVVGASDGGFDDPGLLGTNRDEGTIFIALVEAALGRPINAAEYVLFLNIFFGTENTGQILRQYPAVADGDNGPVMSRVTTDYLFTCANRYVAGFGAPSPFVYQFDQVSNFNIWPQVPACAEEVCHGDELVYVFHTAAKSGFQFTPPEERLSRDMVGYWGSFATDLAPAGTTPWPAFGEAKEYQILKDPISTAADPFAETCDFWDGIGYNLTDPWTTLFDRGQVGRVTGEEAAEALAAASEQGGE